MFFLRVCEWDPKGIIAEISEWNWSSSWTFLFVFFNEKVGLTAAKYGLNEFLGSRFLNVAPSDSCAADCSFSFRFWIIEVISYRVKEFVWWISLASWNNSNEAWIFNITTNAEHPEFLILTAVFRFDIQDRSDKRVLNHKRKIKLKEIIKEKMQSDSFKNFFVNRTEMHYM